MMDPLDHLQMLKDGAAGIASPRERIKRARALRFSEPGFDRQKWREMCADGWLERRSAVAFAAIAENLGRGLTPEPVVEAAMAARLLPPEHAVDVLAGERIVLPAWQEDPGSLNPDGSTSLRDGRLTGRKIAIPMAAGADAFLVSVPGGLALVERGAPGLSLDIRPTPDGGNLGSLDLDDAPAQAIEGDAAEALEHVIMGSSAYLLGLMEQAFAQTLEHTKTREAFGRKDGALQAAQHRVDDMRVQLDLTRGTLSSAAEALDAATPLTQRQGAVSRARLRALDAVMVLLRTCLQLHSSIGPNDIRLFQDRATVVASLYGPPSLHRRRFRGV